MVEQVGVVGVLGGVGETSCKRGKDLVQERHFLYLAGTNLDMHTYMYMYIVN